VGLAAVGIALLELLPHSILQDTWLALLAGREIAHSGVPYHETLTSFAAGTQLINQQWLAQVLMYWIYRIGGIALLGIVNVALITSGIAGAVITARKLGAAPASVIRVLPPALFMILLSTEVRTQGYAYPLFAVTVYLLARDSRVSSRHVYWCLPLLVLWGNLHGSASLGAGLVGLRALALLWERRSRLPELVSWLRPIVLGVGAPLCLLVTPYGLSMTAYYRATLLNGAFRQYISEWQPITAVPVVAILFFILATFVVWSFGRYQGRTTLWERAALLALGAAAIASIRNVEWFGLATLALLPLSIDATVKARQGIQRSRPKFNLALAGTAFAVVIGMLAATLARPDSSFERPYPLGAVSAVRAAVAADPSVRVYSDERFADWLLWRLPSLRGRLAYDARFEVLTSRQLRWIVNLKLQAGLDWKRAARGYQLLVLPTTPRPVIAAFEREPGHRILYQHDGVVVILRSVAQAAA
jgi:hypothetical protein